MPTTPIDAATRHPLARPAMPLRVGLALLAVLAAGAALGRPPRRRVCHVPGAYAAIQDAVDAVATNNLPSAPSSMSQPGPTGN